MFYKRLNPAKTMRFFASVLITAGCTVLLSVAASAQTQGVLTANSVNVRDNPSLTASNILTRVDTGQTVDVYEAEGDFYRVKVNDYDDVYIASQFIKITQVDGTVTDGFALVYNQPDVGDNTVAAVLHKDDVVIVTAVCGDWYQLLYDEKTGYVMQEGLSVPLGDALPTLSPDGGTLADEIIAYAKTFLGTPYLYGSINPKRGFDCSGFLYVVMQQFGISLNRSSSGMASNGIAVDRSDLQKGDLIFFSTLSSRNTGVISHVGMYIGDGLFIHSSSGSSKNGVVIETLSKDYYSTRYVKATRVL